MMGGNIKSAAMKALSIDPVIWLNAPKIIDGMDSPMNGVGKLLYSATYASFTNKCPFLI